MDYEVCVEFGNNHLTNQNSTRNFAKVSTMYEQSPVIVNDYTNIENAMHKVYYQNVLIHTWHFVMRRAIILACQKY
jgi:hypothetical protein